MELPKMPPTYIRREAHPDYEAEIWQPDWNCFACHDTGAVIYWLVLKVIPDYDPHRCPQLLCQHPDCKAGREMNTHPTLADQFDRRFTPDICITLEQMSRQDWKNTVKNKHRKAVDIAALTKKLTMPGTKPRTENDNREAEIKKQEAQAALDNAAAERKRKAVEDELGF